MAERRKTDRPKPYAGGPIAAWPRGMDNIHDSTDLTVDVLRDALNVHFSTSGKPVSRYGVTPFILDAGAHSIFSDGKRMVWATATALKLTRSGITTTTVLSSALLANPLSYVPLNGAIYFSNEKINGIIDANDTYQVWGATGPDLSSYSSASKKMTADEYQSDAYGEVLYSTARGIQMHTQFMIPPPYGQILEQHNGRIWIASDNVLWRTQALRYDMLDPEEDFLMFPERITMVLSVKDGLYVSAHETVFLPNAGTDDVEIKTIFPYKAIEGAARHYPNSEDVVWLSERGIVVAGPGGDARNVTESQIAMESTDRACMGIIEQNGIKSIVAIMRDGDVSPLAAKDFVEGEATRIAEVE